MQMDMDIFAERYRELFLERGVYFCNNAISRPHLAAFIFKGKYLHCYFVVIFTRSTFSPFNIREGTLSGEIYRAGTF